ncbi:MAG: hypothetical protein MSD82_00240 [Prevotella sp.]|nr:hypothetical protein [Prevotella sp.]
MSIESLSGDNVAETMMGSISFLNSANLLSGMESGLTSSEEANSCKDRPFSKQRLMGTSVHWRV